MIYNHYYTKQGIKMMENGIGVYMYINCGARVFGDNAYIMEFTGFKFNLLY